VTAVFTNIHLKIQEYILILGCSVGLIIQIQNLVYVNIWCYTYTLRWWHDMTMKGKQTQKVQKVLIKNVLFSHIKVVYWMLSK